MAKRKKPHVEHPDERWLLTYADMITLLMALFMVMFAMSSVSKTKFQILKVTLHQTFSSAVFDGGSSILDRGAMKSSQTMPNSELTGQDSAQIGEQPVESPTKPGDKTQSGSANTAHQAQLAAAAASRQEADLANAEKTINAAIKKAHLGAYAHIVQDRANGLVIIRLVSDRVLFDLGSYELKPGAKPLLSAIAHALEKLPNAITVDGYTDAIPAGGQFGNNGLSYFRAQSVLDLPGGRRFRRRRSALHLSDRARCARPLEAERLRWVEPAEPPRRDPHPAPDLRDRPDATARPRRSAARSPARTSSPTRSAEPVSAAKRSRPPPSLPITRLAPTSYKP